MSKIKGTVANVGKGKFSYFIMLEEKSEFYFNTKFEPKCGLGDTVGIEFEQKAANRGNVKKVTLLTDSGSAKGVADYDSSSTSDTGGVPVKRQDSIVFQNSRTAAIRTLKILLVEEAFATKGKPDEKRIQIEALIDELTARYFNAAINPRESSVLKENAEIEQDGDDGEASAWPEESAASGEWED